MLKIGILGGTFDPIHEGHLMVAESVRECLSLDKVIFIPAGRPWLKSGQSVTAPVHRLSMVELAIEGNPHFEVSRIEIERPGPTYTVDTLTELRRRKEDAELYLILGMDSVRDLGRWHRPERIFELCWVAAVHRPGVADVSVRDLERVFPSSAGRIRMVTRTYGEHERDGYQVARHGRFDAAGRTGFRARLYHQTRVIWQRIK